MIITVNNFVIIGGGHLKKDPLCVSDYTRYDTGRQPRLSRRGRRGPWPTGLGRLGPVSSDVALETIPLAWTRSSEGLGICII